MNSDSRTVQSQESESERPDSKETLHHKATPHTTTIPHERDSIFLGFPASAPLDLQYGTTDWPGFRDGNGTYGFDGSNNGLNEGCAVDSAKPYGYEDGRWMQEGTTQCAYGPKSDLDESASPNTAVWRSGIKDAASIPYDTAVAGTVTRVIDGDTILVDRETKIRLALVNTPERGKPGHEEAASFARLFCPGGSTIIYDLDHSQKYGMVWCSGYGSGSGVSLNELLLANGLAEIDCKAYGFKLGGCQ